MKSKRKRQNKDGGNSKDLTVVPIDSSRVLRSQKRVKLKEVEGVSVSGKEKATSSNPLLIDLVLENVFSYLENSPPNCIKDFRLVCKLWDRKIKETLRKKTEIDVSRLVSPYPEGLGWTAKCSGDNEGPSYIYQCPYPVEPNFENLKVIGTCEALKNVGVIHWFERMGSNVKSFHFQSPLTCYHQTRFLECVLKRWCNNLSRLYLDGGIWDRPATVVSSGFNNDPFLMDQLKEIIINGESKEVDSGRDCVEGLNLTYLNYPQTDKSNEDIVDIDMKSSDDPGGVWDAIVSHVGSEKLIVKNLPPKNDNSYCEDLFPPRVMSKKQVRLVETLKHFEYQNFVFFHDYGDLIHFREMKFPITKLCFGPFFFHLDDESVTSLLESLSATLQHLEFQGDLFLQSRNRHRIAMRETLDVEIPLLPHLKFYKNGNISSIHTGRIDFVNKLPSLQTCSLQSGGGAGNILSFKPFFHYSCYCCGNCKEHNLKELELIGKIRCGRHVEAIGKWFPNLKKLAVMLEGKDVFTKCIDLVQKLGLEEVKISSYTGDKSLNTALIYGLSKMPNLRSLEMDFLTDSPFKISMLACQVGFATAPKLTSLKLKNVSMFLDERESIREALSHISCVSFIDCVVQPRPTNLEFSIGTNMKFPAIECSNIVK